MQLEHLLVSETPAQFKLPWGAELERLRPFTRTHALQGLFDNSADGLAVHVLDDAAETYVHNQATVVPLPVMQPQHIAAPSGGGPRWH